MPDLPSLGDHWHHRRAASVPQRLSYAATRGLPPLTPVLPTGAAPRTPRRTRPHPTATRPLRPAAGRPPRPRRGGVGVGAVRGGPVAGQGPAGAADRHRGRGAPRPTADQPRPHARPGGTGRRGSPRTALDGRRRRRVGPAAPPERGPPRPVAAPRTVRRTPGGRGARPARLRCRPGRSGPAPRPGLTRLSRGRAGPARRRPSPGCPGVGPTG